jgi:hypothetical protein
VVSQKRDVAKITCALRAILYFSPSPLEVLDPPLGTAVVDLEGDPGVHWNPASGCSYLTLRSTEDMLNGTPLSQSGHTIKKIAFMEHLSMLAIALKFVRKWIHWTGRAGSSLKTIEMGVVLPKSGRGIQKFRTRILEPPFSKS